MQPTHAMRMHEAFRRELSTCRENPAARSITITLERSLHPNRSYVSCMKRERRARARACEKQGLSITADRANVGQSSYKLAKDVLFYRWDPSDVMIFAFSCLIATLQRVAQTDLKRIPTFRGVGHVGLPVHFVASPELHGRFKCCLESRNTSAILSTCLALFCTFTTFTATAFPSPSPPCHFSVHISHSITRCPAPSPTSFPDSHMLS
jgi:hypothetical protein